MEHLHFPRYLPIRRTAFEFEMHLIEAEHCQPSVLRRESQRIGGGRGRSGFGRMRVSCPIGLEELQGESFAINKMSRVVCSRLLSIFTTQRTQELIPSVCDLLNSKPNDFAIVKNRPVNCY
jgi:hypothetical protein